MTKTKIEGFDRSQVLAPLVIGITGHRDLREEDRKALEDKVKEIFVKLHEDYPETPLVLVSPLAEGADRLAAEAALSANVGVHLIVPFPMPQELYEEDFDHLADPGTSKGTATKTSTRKEFHALLDKARSSFPLDLADGNTYERLAHQGPERDRQYDVVGQYIARQSQILIALWDGVDSGRMGGTSSVVCYQTEGVPDRDVCALEAPEGFPAYHIFTPRQKNPHPEGPALSLRTIYPRVFRESYAKAENYFGNMFRRLDEFNRYINRADDELAKEIAQSKSYLLQKTREDELPSGMLPALNRYAVADALAIRFQKHWLFAQTVLHALILFAFVFFLLFADQKEHWIGYLIISAVLVFFAFALRISARKWAWDTQHEDYRAMAEGLRVKFFWRLTGIMDPIADHYLGKQRSELDWIRNGFRGWNVAEGAETHGKREPLHDGDLRKRLEFARKYWIDDQDKYFCRARAKNFEYHECLERAGRVCIIGVAILGVVLLVRSLFDLSFLEPVAIALEVMLAGAAIFHHFNNRMAFAEHAKQYERVATLFAHGSKLMGKFLKHHDCKNALQCVKNVGNEALAENGDWVLLHRERPLEVPHP